MTPIRRKHRAADRRSTSRATQRAGATATHERISHVEILDSLCGGEDGSGNLVCIYRNRVLPTKTRTIRLLGTKSSARILHTLLGFEVQAWYKRIQCPDMVTARYLKLFTELGCHSIRLPYDPTLTAEILPGLEAAYDRIVTGVRDLFPRQHELQVYVLRKVFEIIRQRLQSE